MMHKRMTDLLTVTEAVYQREHQKLRPLLQKEAEILKQLARLDGQLIEVKEDSTRSEGYRVSGADLLWHGWEATTRRQLNAELARIRAQKLSAMDDLRRAFGRKQAVSQLSTRLQNRKRRASNE